MSGASPDMGQADGNTEAGREFQSLPEKGIKDRILVYFCIREVDRIGVRGSGNASLVQRGRGSRGGMQ